MNKPYPLGKIVRPYGKVVMVAITSGERYYWLKDKDGCISMMPATVIESEGQTEESQCTS